MSGLFFGGLFWGLLICLIGLSIVLKYAFHIHLPITRVFLGIIIILIGLRIVIGQSSKHKIRVNEYSKSYQYSNKCDVVFSSGTVDLTTYTDINSLPREISVVFGSAVVLVPDSLNLEVTSTTVFGTTVLPDRSYAGFGEDRYVMKNKPGAPTHKIVTNTVFGKLVFEQVPTVKPAESDSTGTGEDTNF